jgi:hypothetical protein
MEFVLTFQQPADAYQKEADPVKGQPVFQAWMAYMGEMEAQGVIRGGNRLDSAAGSAVRIREGKLRVEDQFGHDNELLGGYVVIDVPSLDDAVKWASRSPSSLTGSTFVYPVMAEPS